MMQTPHLFWLDLSFPINKTPHLYQPNLEILQAKPKPATLAAISPCTKNAIEKAPGCNLWLWGHPHVIVITKLKASKAYQARDPSYDA